MACLPYALVVSGLLLAIVSTALRARGGDGWHADEIMQAQQRELALHAVREAERKHAAEMFADEQGSVACNPWPHMGYSAEHSFTWGASFKVKDERECCQACLAHNRTCGQPGSAGKTFWHASLQPGGSKCGNVGLGCNVWTYCPEERCFAFDIHNHTRNECWLKHSTTPLTPAVGSGGPYAPEMRAAPRKFWPWAVALDVWPWPMPEQASWTSGVLTAPGAQIAPQRPNINRMFCESKHGPCPSQSAAVWPPPRAR